MCPRFMLSILVRTTLMRIAVVIENCVTVNTPYIGFVMSITCMFASVFSFCKGFCSEKGLEEGVGENLPRDVVRRCGVV
jgi:hypothetical protein